MTLYILDTDQVSLSQREHPLVLRRMAAAGSRNLATTIITVEEQIGLLRLKNKSVDVLLSLSVLLLAKN